MKTIMVTGSGGYIGSNLCPKLLERGYNIVQIDKKFDFFIEDLNKKDFQGIDAVVHLAATSGIKNCECDKDAAIKNNIKNTIRLLDLFTSQKDVYQGNTFIFASSQSAKNPLSSIYAMTKYISEYYVKNAYGLNGYNLRFSNVYGGNKYIDLKTSVVAQFIKAYKTNSPLMVDGDGSQIRDFIHVDDVCDIILNMLNLDPTHKRIIGKDTTLDVGTGKETSILQLAQYFNHPIRFKKSKSSIGVKSNVANPSFLKNLFSRDIPDRLAVYIKSMI